MASISDIEGIGPAYAQKLTDVGVATTEQLLEAGASSKGREDIATKTGIASKLILEWVNHADLYRVKGIGSQYADLLEAAGVDSVPELGQRKAANLVTKLAQVNDEKHLVRQMPSESTVAGWIDHAKTVPKMVTH